MKNPKICILKTDGINCDQEMQHAFETADAVPELVHINQIRDGQKRLADYAGLGLPGGFSYGDDIASGAVLANELTAYLGDELQEFVDARKPVIGVCNGFQVLVRTGILPGGTTGEQTASLAANDVGHFVCRWLDLQVPDNRCQFIPDDAFESLIPMQIAHGEGRFVTRPETLAGLASNQQIVFTYDQNPNGSQADIAGICNPSGTVLGMMPHPERSIASMHPDRSRTSQAQKAARLIFNSFVAYAREL